MNPQDINNSGTAVQDAGAEADIQPSSMPLGVGQFDDQVSQDPLSGGDSGKRFDTGIVLIVVVVLCAAGGLFAMRKIAQAAVPPSTSSEVETTIDNGIKMVEGPLGNEDTALTVLTEDFTDRQVPLDSVQRNPFILFEPVSEDTPVEQTRNQFEDEKIKREGQIRTAGGRLSVRSILMGTTPLVNLNDKILRVGEVVVTDNIEFEITEIKDDVVTLRAEDLIYQLEIEIQVYLDRN